MNRSLSLLAVVLLVSNAYSQDIHFSQYNQTPSLVNPALTGAATVVRASLIYKDQWRSVTTPYKTFGASYEMKFKASNWEKVDKHTSNHYKKAFSRMAGGLSFFSDKAGDGNMGTTQANVSVASFVPLSAKSSLSLGLQGSLVQRSVDFSKLIFPSQYNGLSYDANVSAGETGLNQNFIYPDFAGGVNWSYGHNEKSIHANNEFRANAGVAMYHINRPKQKYLSGADTRLYSKYVLHGDFLIGIKHTTLALAPSYLVQLQFPSKEMVVGMMVKNYFKEDSKYTGIIKRSSFGMGAYYRNKDSFIVSALLEFGQYAIGYSYDLNVSRLTTASSGRGGSEISIRFVTPNPFLYEKAKARF